VRIKKEGDNESITITTLGEKDSMKSLRYNMKVISIISLLLGFVQFFFERGSINAKSRANQLR